nr:hypothetical protein [Gluconobacter thailandicus]
MVDGNPIELRAEIGLNLRHQIAGIARQVGKIPGILRRDDEPELMAVVAPTIEKRITIGTVFRPRIEPSPLAIAGGAVALDVAEMGSGLAVSTCCTNGARFDDDATATRSAMAPAVRKIAGTYERRAPSSPHTTPGRDASLPFRCMSGTAASGTSAPAGRRLLLACDGPHLGQETPGTTDLRRVGADTARPRAEPVVVARTHDRRSIRNGPKQARVPRKTGRERTSPPVAAPYPLKGGATQNNVQTRACPADRTHGVPSALILRSLFCRKRPVFAHFLTIKSIALGVPSRQGI